MLFDVWIERNFVWMNTFQHTKKKWKWCMVKTIRKIWRWNEKFWNILNTFIRLTFQRHVASEANYFILVNIFAPFISQWKKTFGFGTQIKKKIIRMLYFSCLHLSRANFVLLCLQTLNSAFWPRRRAIMIKQKINFCWFCLTQCCFYAY